MSTNRAREIFIELIANVAPDQWEVRLAELAAGDQELRDKVASLLAAHGQGDSLLEQPAPAITGMADDPSKLAGLVLVDRYKLLELIGDGGMGSVWMAQQIEPVKRLVAIKLIRSGIDNKQILARFEAERQALALMDHPNIARILDAGVTPDDRSFFVMELVKGVPITRYCDERHLTLRQRLELFVPVCEAIQHAHHKGIIHRDIKPSNVLIAQYDERAVPKVIDFGVATATGQPLTEKTLHTNFGMVVGTPEYMSPEQASLNQLDVDTRSDIYSLGVLMYELLAGCPPFSQEELQQAGLLEMLKVIRERDPERPSTKLSTASHLPVLAVKRGTDPKELTNLLRGELDWIAMKALEKQRNARYASASEFAADIERFLNDEPITARPPTTVYRLQKLVHKHKGPVAAVATIVAAIVILGGAALWQGVRAQEQARMMRAQSILTSAAAAEDPLLKAQLLLETDASLPGWLNVAREAASQPLPVAVMRSHEWNITYARFLPDGERVFTASRDGVARVWRIDGTAEPVVLEGQHYRNWALSPDGRLAANAANGADGGSVFGYVWRTDGQGDVVRLGPEANTEGTLSAAFSPDDQRVAIGGRDGIARVWRVDGGEPPLILEGSGSIERLEFSPDGSRLLGAADESIYIWRLDAPEERIVLDGVATAAAFSPDGAYVAIVADDDSVRVWRLDETNEPTVLQGHGGRIESIAFSSDGNRLVTGSADQTARIWAVDDPVNPVTFRGHSGAVTNALFSPDGAWVATASDDGTARLWSADGEGRPLILAGHEAPVTHIAFNGAGTLLLTGSADTTVRVWSLDALGDDAADSIGEVRILPAIRGERQRGSLTHPPALEFSPDGTRLVATWQTAPVVRVRSLVDEETVELPIPAYLARFSADGTSVITAADPALALSAGDVTVRQWRTTGRGAPLVLRTIELDESLRPAAAALSRDGLQIAVAFRDAIRVWRTDTNEPPLTLDIPAVNSAMSSLSFSPDGRRLVAADLFSVAYAWKLDEPNAPVIFDGHLDEVISAEFSPDGNLIVSTSSDATARVWRADDGSEVAVFRADDRWVNSASFSPDGQRIVTGGMHGTVRVFSMTDAGEILALDAGAYVVRVAFSPSGDEIAASLSDGQIRVWQISTAALRDYLGAHVSTGLTPAQRMQILGESE